MSKLTKRANRYGRTDPKEEEIMLLHIQGVAAKQINNENIKNEVLHTERKSFLGPP